MVIFCSLPPTPEVKDPEIDSLNSLEILSKTTKQ